MALCPLLNIGTMVSFQIKPYCVALSQRWRWFLLPGTVTAWWSNLLLNQIEWIIVKKKKKNYCTIMTWIGFSLKFCLGCNNSNLQTANRQFEHSVLVTAWPPHYVQPLVLKLGRKELTARRNYQVFSYPNIFRQAGLFNFSCSLELLLLLFPLHCQMCWLWLISFLQTVQCFWFYHSVSVFL